MRQVSTDGQSGGVLWYGVKAKTTRMLPYLAEFPELVWVGLQHCNTTFVYQGRRWVPRLDLLPEDDLDVICVLRLYYRYD